MKKSKLIPLVMLGTLVLTGCGQTPDSDEDGYVALDDSTEIKQNTYTSLDDCKRDWEDASRCIAAPATSPHTGGSAFVYMGPRYFYNHSTGIPMMIMPNMGGSTAYVATPITSSGFSSRASSTDTVARGGSFGGRGIAASGGRGGFGASAGGHGGGGESGGG